MRSSGLTYRSSCRAASLLSALWLVVACGGGGGGVTPPGGTTNGGAAGDTSGGTTGGSTGDATGGSTGDTTGGTTDGAGATAPTLDTAVSATTGAVRGTVELLSATGRQATQGRPAVWIEVGGQQYFQSTGTDGSFAFGSLPSGGSFDLSAAYPGYTRQQSNIAIQANNVANAGTFQLPADSNPQTGGLTGLVIDSQGNPVGGALIGISNSTNFGLTGGDGIYSFVELPPTELEVTAQKAGVGQASQKLTITKGRMSVVTLRLTGAQSGGPQPPTVNVEADRSRVSVTVAVKLKATVQPAVGRRVEKYEWDFEGDGRYDGESDSTAESTFAYDTAGIYNATLRVTDDAGQANSNFVTIRVLAARKPTVTAYVSPSGGSVHQVFTFNATTTADPVARVTYYQWDFDGDGKVDATSGSTAERTWSYTTAGTYAAKLTVTDNFGQTASATVNVGVDAVSAVVVVD